MCCILKCFSWTLDLFQRVLTFALSCVLMAVICIGVSVTVVASVAYGYNYMLAEFLTFPKQDIAVYVRRGQFYDRPEINARRSGADNDPFATNENLDYQESDKDKQDDAKSLQDTMHKAQDANKYSGTLAKYSNLKPEELQKALRAEKQSDLASDEEKVIPNNKINPPSLPFRTSPSPLQTILTTLISKMSISDFPRQPGVMRRKFVPVTSDYQSQLSESIDSHKPNYYKYSKNESKKEQMPLEYEEERPDIKIMLNDKPRSISSPAGPWGNPSKELIDYNPEDGEEDNILYKSV